MSSQTFKLYNAWENNPQNNWLPLIVYCSVFERLSFNHSETVVKHCGQLCLLPNIQITLNTYLILWAHVKIKPDIMAKRVVHTSVHGVRFMLCLSKMWNVHACRTCSKSRRRYFVINWPVYYTWYWVGRWAYIYFD